MANKYGTLPDDVVEMILVLLPTKSLAKCRAVCKHWDTLISSPQFIKLLCSAKDKSMNYITPVKIHFVEGLLQGEEFRVPEAIRKSSWDTIWEQLVAATPNNTPRDIFT